MAQPVRQCRVALAARTLILRCNCAPRRPQRRSARHPCGSAGVARGPIRSVICGWWTPTAMPTITLKLRGILNAAATLAWSNPANWRVSSPRIEPGCHVGDSLPRSYSAYSEKSGASSSRPVPTCAMAIKMALAWDTQLAFPRDS